jgi:hypothetical protein
MWYNGGNMKIKKMKICSVKGTKIKGQKLLLPELREIGPPLPLSKIQKYTWELEFDRRVSAHDLAILFEKFGTVFNEWQKTIKLPKK